MPTNYTSFLGAQVTLASATTVYNLWSLLTAIDPNAPPIAAELWLQSDSTNAGGSLIYIGDASLAKTSRQGFVLAVSGTKQYTGNLASDIPVSGIFLQGSADSLKVNVELTLS